MLFHITEQAAWETARTQGIYCAPSLTEEGFIHFSKSEQVIEIANRFYKGQSDLVLLQVDPTRLSSPLRHDDVAGHGTFPHLYGPLNLDAVIAVKPFAPSPDGYFAMPL